MNAPVLVPDGIVRRSVWRIRFSLVFFLLWTVAYIGVVFTLKYFAHAYYFSPSDIGQITLIHENVNLVDGKTIKVKKAFVIRSDEKTFVLTEDRIGTETMSSLREGDVIVGLTYHKVVKVCFDDAIAGVVSKDNSLAPALPDEISLDYGVKKSVDLKRKF